MNKHNIYDSATAHTIKYLEERIAKLEQQNKLIIEKYNFAMDFIFDYYADEDDEDDDTYKEIKESSLIPVEENED